ncbi:MAG: PAC2 family protein [Myxococcota bacterium]
MAASSPLRIRGESDLRKPTLVVAYAGWGDGGEAATTTVKYLLGQLAAQPLATLDTEEFLDFTVVRPRIGPGSGERRITWPDHEFFSAYLPELPNDLVLGLGIEPHLRWKTYARLIVELARRLEVGTAILVGAYVADVIYSQPVLVHGSSNDPELMEQLGFEPSGYEGPTGISGVLAHALGGIGVRTLSLWAALPHYIAVTPNPRGCLALLQRIERVTGIEVEKSGMHESVRHFDESVADLVSNDPELSAYVRELKRRAFSG